MSSQQVALDELTPRLRRKIESQTRERKRAHRKALKDTGAKPKWVKSLSIRESEKTLREFDAIATPAEIYRAAFERGNVPLIWQMRQDVENRVFGKPYTAINPAEKPVAPINQDNRLQVAIQNLIMPSAKPRKTLKAQPLTLAGDVPQPNPIQAAAKPGDGQEN